VNEKAAIRMPPKPTHDIALAIGFGILASWRLPTATNAPSASSQARENGEKKAAMPLVEVWWSDHANESSIPNTSNAVSFRRRLT
jgi:hypothetical protein